MLGENQIRVYPEYLDTYTVETDVQENGLGFEPEWVYDETGAVISQDSRWNGAENVEVSAAVEAISTLGNKKITITPEELSDGLVLSVEIEQYKETREQDSEVNVIVPLVMNIDINP